MIFLVTSCDDVEPPGEENHLETDQNHPPEKVPVFVENITHNSAILYWGEAFDPEQDALNYSVFLGDSMILANSSCDSLIYLENLLSNRNYQGQVRVSDPYHPPVESNFSFSTRANLVKLDRTYAGEGAFSIQQADDKGYVVLGTLQNVKGMDVPYVFKVDSLGYIIWDLKLETSYFSFNQRGKLLKTAEGTYLVAAYGLLAEIDDQGNIIWEKNFEDRKLVFQSILEVAGEGYIATVHMDNINSYYIKIDRKGSIIREAILAPLEFYRGVFLDKIDNEIFCQGISSDSIWTAGLNTEGEILWESRYATNSNRFFLKTFKRTPDGGFITSGYSVGLRDIAVGRIIRFDASGVLIWDKSYEWDSFKTYINGLRVESDGYLIWGSAGYDIARAFMAKINFSGDILWREFYAPDYMDYIWIINDAISNLEGGYGFCGTKRFVWNGEGKEVGMWVKRVDTQGSAAGALP